MPSLIDAEINIRPLRTAAIHLLEACNSDETCANDIVGILRTDAGMSMQILKVANSPVYGFAGRISSVEHATVILGFREVSKLSMALASAEVFGQDDGSTNLRKMLWKHSLGCACVARALAVEGGTIDGECAFLAGIVHDVGKLAFLDASEPEYADLFAQNDGAYLHGYEAERFDINHQDMGFRCTEDWGLPLDVMDGIQLHHDEEAMTEDDLVRVVAMANAFARKWQIGSGDHQAERTEASCAPFESVFTEEQLTRVERVARGEFQTMTSACSA